MVWMPEVYIAAGISFSRYPSPTETSVQLEPQSFRIKIQLRVIVQPSNKTCIPRNYPQLTSFLTGV